VDTGSAPWFDWGPYLWANGPNVSSTGLFWCNGQSGNPCNLARDVRYGDTNNAQFWGDFTHPTANAEDKVANALVTFIKTSPWVTPWIGN
jgi:hypothetical protein